MAIYITAVHMAYGGSSHEHIASVRWTNPQTREHGDNLRAAIVDWIDNRGGDARVVDGGSYVQVGVVRPSSGEPYLRTYADGVWKDNLLALPRY